jgi:hypothetical protein
MLTSHFDFAIFRNNIDDLPPFLVAYHNWFRSRLQPIPFHGLNQAPPQGQLPSKIRDENFIGAADRAQSALSGRARKAIVKRQQRRFLDG